LAFELAHSTNAEHKRSVIQAYYTPATTFDDPLVSVRGLPEITSQFLFLTLFSSIDNQINSITTTPSYGDHGQLVTVDSSLVFTIIPWVFKIPVRTVTHLHFDGQGRVIKHEDIWSLREVAGSVVGVGWMYEMLRRVNGYVSSVVIEKAFEGMNWWKVRRVGAKVKRGISSKHVKHA
jgi:hypothetical protein